jgi:hypothetical protein
MLSRVVQVVTACLLLGTRVVHGFGVLGPDYPEKGRLECFNYLKSYLPPRDVNLTDEWLNRNVDMALIPRFSNSTPWAHQVPWDLFLNDVLPYARYCMGITPVSKHGVGLGAGCLWR